MLFCGVAHGKTPTETASEYFETLKQKDYASAAQFFDPKALSDFREMMNFTEEFPPEVRENFYKTFFGQDSTAESVSNLSDAQFFQYFIGATLAQAESAGGISFDHIEILGEVEEEPDTSHVVVRNKISVGEITIEAMEIVSFIQRGKEWKVLLSGKLKGLPLQIKAALNRQK